MISKHSYFLSGLLAATLSVAGFFSIDQIQAAGGQLKQEIKFARQIGIYDSTNYSAKMLNRPISESAFYLGLSSVLHELGIVATTSPREMKRAGIMPALSSGLYITRKSACEGIFRAIHHGIDCGAIISSSDRQTFQPFYDWIVEEKYMAGLNIAIEKGIIKGMPNGRFSPLTQLKTRDALILFKRIHDAFSGSHASKSASENIVANEEEIQVAAGKSMSLERLQKAGAFSQLKSHLDLQNENPISLGDLNTMLQGILHQAERPAFISELKYLTRNMKPQKPVSRGKFAYMASTLVRALPTQQVDSHILYADVDTKSGLGRALSFLSRTGVRLGYENNILKAHEYVSTTEALGVIDKILENAEQMNIDTASAATRSDFEQFKSLIEARKARIRRILNRH